jgi:hypothetical protein
MLSLFGDFMLDRSLALRFKRVVEVMELSLCEQIAQILISNRSAGAACSRSVFLSNGAAERLELLGIVADHFKFDHVGDLGFGNVDVGSFQARPV